MNMGPINPRQYIAKNVQVGNITGSIDNALASKDDKKLKEVCSEFESILLQMMYKSMKNTVPKSDLIPEHSGREIFESMLDEEIVRNASKNRSLGLAEAMYKTLKSKRNSYRETE
jgi:flagellar protein FlgJ